MKKVELLAPAGNMESLIAAVQAGCDAVYLGMNAFSARAFAGNFTKDELVEAVRYCHIRDVKVYVTMNTILYETEVEAAQRQIQFLYEHDVDALLIQDFGLFHYVRTCYPDFDVHCSTQMHIHNLAGVEFMKSQGAKRVVLARESSIELVTAACKTGMEIEVFAYGAICISYSGQCQFSAVTKQRSANRGMCAQCCRMKYFPDDKEKFQEGDYILSPKDLNVIKNLPQLLDSGVCSLKIEGRMKRPEYVWLITKTFREAIDAYYRNESFKMSKQREEELLLMFNRGFSNGHLFHDTVSQRMSPNRPNHQGIIIGEVLDYRNDKVKVKLYKPLYQHDGLRILSQPEDIGLTAVKIYNEKNFLINQAAPNQIVTLNCKEGRPKKGDKLHKTSDARLLKQIDGSIQNQHRITSLQMSYSAKVDHPLELILSDGSHTILQQSEVCLEAAKNSGLTKERLEENLSKVNRYAYRIQSIKGDLENVFLPISIINETRRRALEKMDQVRATRHVRKGKKTYTYHTENRFDMDYRLIVQTKEAVELPYADCLNVIDQVTVTKVVDEFQAEKQKFVNCVLSQAGDLTMELKDCIAGMTLNVVNSYAIAYLLSISGIKAVILSEEMNDTQILLTIQAFEKRYGFTAPVYKFVYGKRRLMHIKDSFTDQKKIKFLSDLHGKKYELSYNADMVSIKESVAFRADNPYCMGSYVIFDDEIEHLNLILEEL